jgi:hypothetical protein
MRRRMERGRGWRGSKGDVDVLLCGDCWSRSQLMCYINKIFVYDTPRIYRRFQVCETMLWYVVFYFKTIFVTLWKYCWGAWLFCVSRFSVLSFCGYLANSFVWHVLFVVFGTSFIFTYGVLSCAIGLSFSWYMVHKEIINYGRYR